MLTKKEMSIIGIFRKNLFDSCTIREIMKRVDTKSYSWVYNAAKKLEKEGILNLERKGKSEICSINLNSNTAISYLSFLEHLIALQSSYLPMKNIKKLIDSIQTPFFVFIVTGSYAAKEQTAKSDLDVAVIVDNSIDKRKIHAQLKEGNLMIPEVHSYVFTSSEFLEMLLNKEANYGKLLYRKRIILFGAENYYLMVKEAIKNGFRG